MELCKYYQDGLKYDCRKNVKDIGFQFFMDGYKHIHLSWRSSKKYFFSCLILHYFFNSSITIRLQNTLKEKIYNLDDFHKRCLHKIFYKRSILIHYCFSLFFSSFFVSFCSFNQSFNFVTFFLDDEERSLFIFFFF